MTKDDIIKLAREAGFTASNGFSQLIVRHSNGSWVDIAENLERFAALVAAAEREECANLCEQWNASHPNALAAAIRARGNT